VAGSLRHPDEGQRAALCRAVAAWAAQLGATPAGAVRAGGVELVDVALLRDGRPGVLDVVATAGGRRAHAVLSLRRREDPLRLLAPTEEPVVGEVEDDHGPALVVDALRDAEAAPFLLAAAGGPEGHRGTLLRAAGRPADPGPAVSVVEEEDEGLLGFDDRCALRVFHWLRDGPHPGVAFLLALDEAGFNHVPAPIARWCRGGWDLGLVQELFVGAAPGWAVALGSLRDLCAAGGRPEDAGGDFAPEARALGTMVARMHVALARAFGRQPGQVAAWAEEAGSVVERVGAAALDGVPLRALRSSDLSAPALRTHGDLHLGRIARTDQGWVLTDCMPGGTADGAPAFRPALADVADLAWSLHHVAAVVVAELARDPLAHPRVADLAAAWEGRNRRALLAGYLSAPGVRGLVPGDRKAVEGLLGLLALARDARLAGRRHPSRSR
jgi:maltokinase